MTLKISYSAQSYLFVPGNRPERFQSALSSGADAVIVDLEDAVEPGAKEDARATLTAWLSRTHPVLVRINGRGTPWFEEDAKLAALDGVAGVVVPKVESASDVIEVASRARRKVPIFPLVETAAGMFSALEIAKAPNVKRLMFGTLDFIAEMGMQDDRDALNPYRAQLALISRVVGLEQPIDGVTPDVNDVERLTADALNGKRQGFGAKLCIHPKQIAAVHGCYRPDAQELAWATRIVDAMAQSDGGVTTVDGKMVDRPVLLRAQHVLAFAAAKSS